MRCNVCIYIWYMHVLIDMHQSDRTWFWPVFGEEQAFWTLVCAFDALGVEGYYTDRMLLLRADMQVLQAFMKVKCPKVAKVGGGAWGGGWGLVGGPCLSKNRVPSHGIVSIFLTEEVIWIDLGAAYPIFRQNQVYEIDRSIDSPSTQVLMERNHTSWTCKAHTHIYILYNIYTYASFIIPHTPHSLYPSLCLVLSFPLWLMLAHPLFTHFRF